MRKLIITLALVIGFAGMADAQSQRSIGVRLGWPGEISYQHPLGEANRLEFGLGFHHEVAYLSGAYEWMFDLPTEGLKWYLGAGPQIGFLWDGYLNLGGFGLIGIEYDLEQHIDFPLLLSLDYRPGIRIDFLSDGALIKPHYSGIALGVRFKF